MKTVLKLYIAGKVSKNYIFKTSFWRDSFCAELAQKSGLKIVNLDPTKTSPGFDLDEKNAPLIFGRDSYMIKSADLVIAYLTDDISVGGSQEMLIAKHFSKPLIGLIPPRSKFRGDKIILGKLYKNWIHPFVKIPCDAVVQDVDELVVFLQKYARGKMSSKNISIVDKTVGYYYSNFFKGDSILHNTSSTKVIEFFAHKALITNPQNTHLLLVKYKDSSGVAKKVRGKFALPGGKTVGNTESPTETLVRRVKEETGVFVKHKTPLYNWSWQYRRSGVVNRIFATAHHAVFESGAVRKPIRRTEYDLERAEWIPISAVKRDLIVSDEWPIVNKYMQSIS